MAVSLVSPMMLVPDSIVGSREGASVRVNPTADLPPPGFPYDELVQDGRIYWGLQRTRIQIGNRVKALERMAAKLGGEIDPAILAPFTDVVLPALEETEEALAHKIERLMRHHPIAPWVQQPSGVGLFRVGLLLGLTGPLDQFPNPAKLWKYVGMHVTDGHAARRERGVRFTKTDAEAGVVGTAYSPDGRALAFNIGAGIVRMGHGPYRAVYDVKKAEYLLRERTGPSKCPFGQTHKDRGGALMKCGLAHLEQAARRYATKRYLRDLWVAWRALSEQ